MDFGDCGGDGDGSAAAPFGYIFLEGGRGTMADYLTPATMDASYKLIITCQPGMCGMLLSCQKGILSRNSTEGTDKTVEKMSENLSEDILILL